MTERRTALGSALIVSLALLAACGAKQGTKSAAPVAANGPVQPAATSVPAGKSIDELLSRPLQLPAASAADCPLSPQISFTPILPKLPSFA